MNEGWQGPLQVIQTVIMGLPGTPEALWFHPQNGWPDYLVPVAFWLGLTAWAQWQRRQAARARPSPPATP